MKKIVLFLAVFCFITTPCFSGIDQSVNKDMEIKNKQKQKQQQGQAQGQLQGQVGINKAVGQGNSTETNVDASDNGDTKVYAPTWASSPSTSGKDEKAVFSLWGGINKNELSTDKKLDWYRGVIIELREHGIITEEELIKELKFIYKTAKKYVAPDKFLGILPLCDNVIVGTIGCF